MYACCLIYTVCLPPGAFGCCLIYVPAAWYIYLLPGKYSYACCLIQYTYIRVSVACEIYLLPDIYACCLTYILATRNTCLMTNIYAYYLICIPAAKFLCLLLNIFIYCLIYIYIPTARYGTLTFSPPTNRSRNVPTHTIRPPNIPSTVTIYYCDRWTQWQFTSVTLWPFNILLLWQMDPVTIYYCGTSTL